MDESILEEAGVSRAEYWLLFHVWDTVFLPKRELAEFVASELRTRDISVDEFVRAADALIARGLLIEITAADAEADAARWRAEPLPQSFGVFPWRAGQVDLTEAGHELYEAMSRREYPSAHPRTHMGYHEVSRDVVRVFGQTPELCQRRADAFARMSWTDPHKWPRGSAVLGPMREIGPWWESRYILVPTGYEIVVSRGGTW